MCLLQSKPNEVKEAVKVAIDAGYRYIDCAYLYLNETEVGEVLQEKIADGTVTRDEMFICSKVGGKYDSKSFLSTNNWPASCTRNFQMLLPKNVIRNLANSCLSVYLRFVLHRDC